MIGLSPGSAKRFPRETDGWKLVLAGGSAADNPFLSRIGDLIAARPDLPVELKVNIPVSDCWSCTGRQEFSGIFCGLHQTEPVWWSISAMTTVRSHAERLACRFVFDGGGQREIVEEGRSGFRLPGSGSSSKRRSASSPTSGCGTELAPRGPGTGPASRGVFESQVKDSSLIADR